MRNRKTQGFTLIELLIVIAIIGILAAVLIPNLMRARNVAVDRAAQGYAQNIYTAGNAWLAENVDKSIDDAVTLATADCSNGPAFGDYSTNAPSFDVDTCVLSNNSGDFRIVLTYNGGVTGVSPITFPAP